MLQAEDVWRFKPATRVENACATGSAAIHHGLKSIAGAQARFVLVVGVEKMTDLPGPEIAKALLSAAYLKEEGEIEGGFAGVFGLALLGATLMAFGLQGLAAVHQITLGRSGRTAMLTVAYLLLVLTQGMLFIALMLFGIMLLIALHRK